MRIATRLRTVMIFLSFNTCCATSRILHTVFSCSVHKRCLQTGGSLGEGTETVRTEVHVLCREAQRAGLVSLELRRLWGNLLFGRAWPEKFYPWRFSGPGWTRFWATCSALSRCLIKRYSKVSSNLNKLYYSIKQNYAVIGEALCVWWMDFLVQTSYFTKNPEWHLNIKHNFLPSRGVR